MAEDVREQIKSRMKEFRYYAFSLDESVDNAFIFAELTRISISSQSFFTYTP